MCLQRSVVVISQLLHTSQLSLSAKSFSFPHRVGVVEPKQQNGKFLKSASPFVSKNSTFGADFGSARSVGSRISYRLAHAKPDLQVSGITFLSPSGNNPPWCYLDFSFPVPTYARLQN